MTDMTTPAVSIIVPVYKAEKYLHKCVESLLSQTFADFEVLLIDDGSPDESGRICDEYAEKDSRVKVFHKENGGVSSARNLGLDMAAGERVMFVDADDWLDNDALQFCLERAGDAEFVRYGMRVVYSQSHSAVDKSINESWNYDEYFSNVVARKTTLSVWGGLYKRSLFETNNIRFNPKYALGEDWLVLYLLLKVTSNIKLVANPLYNYNSTNEGSAVHAITLDKVKQLIDVASIICSDYMDFKKNDALDEILKCKYNTTFYCLVTLLSTRASINSVLKIVFLLKKKGLFPSFHEIFKIQDLLKKKLILLFFAVINFSRVR